MKRLVIIAFFLFSITFSFYNFALASSPVFQTTLTTTPSRTTSATTTGAPSITPTLTITSTRRLTSTLTITPSITTTATISATATPTLTPTMTGTPTPTPIRYPLSVDASALSIDALRARPYGGTGVKIVRTTLTTEAYRQVLIEYSSDGLRISGTMNIPRGIGPFPVVILDHGYFKPAEYKTGDGTSRAADLFARGGYLTIAPDYRCHAGSQCATNPLYVGYAIDVLNLIAQLSSVPDADTSRIGIWGHSMGGGITLRVLAVNDSIKVASLYGSLSGDDEIHYCWLIGCRTPTPTARDPRAPWLETDPDFLQSSLPVNGAPTARLRDLFAKTSASRHLSNVTAAVIIHHGEADDIVPIEWSVELASSLNVLGRTAVLHTYPGEGHVFAGWGWQLFMSRTISFFDNYLRPRESIITEERRVLRQERIAAESSY